MSDQTATWQLPDPLTSDTPGPGHAERYFASPRGCPTLAGVIWEEGDVVRVLAPSEQRFVRHGTYAGRSVSVVGRIDPATMDRAFTQLRHEYPVLVSRIGVDRSGIGYLLRPKDLGFTGMSARYGDPDELGAPPAQLDPAERLVYLDVVLSSRPVSRVTMYTHHAVADGSHSIALFERLWDCYTRFLAEEEPAVVQHEYPEPLEWLAQRRGIERGRRSGFESVSRPLPTASNSGVAEPSSSVESSDSSPDFGAGTATANAFARPRRLQLDPALTAGVVDLARRHRVTVNALLTAAVLRAYAVVNGTDDTPVSLGCLYPVDLRSRLDPPIAPAAGTNMGGMASFAAQIDNTVCVLELARRVSDRLRTDLDDGTVQQSVLHFPDYYGAERNRCLAGHVAITNTGVIPEFSTPADISLTDYEMFYLSAHPQPSLGASVAVTFLAYTYAARLTVALLGAVEQQQRLLATVYEELDAPVRALRRTMEPSPVG